VASILRKAEVMRRKARALDSSDPATPSDTLRGELERLGLARAEAGPLAEQLLGLARARPEREFQALLEGVALGRRAGGPRTPELQRILEDFAAEMKKLDEGLRLLTAYLSRLREHAAPSAVARTLH